MHLLTAYHETRHSGRDLQLRRRRQAKTIRSRARARVRRMLVLLFATLALIVVATADAHDGSVALTATQSALRLRTFRLVRHITNVIRVDHATTSSGSFSITGPSATHVLANHVDGNHTVTASASWGVDNGGTAQSRETLACEALAVAPPVVVPPPPAVVPVPAVAPQRRPPCHYRSCSRPLPSAPSVADQMAIPMTWAAPVSTPPQPRCPMHGQARARQRRLRQGAETSCIRQAGQR